MDLKKLIGLGFIVLGHFCCDAIQPMDLDALLPGQGIFYSIGLSPEASQMVFEEETNALLKELWTITLRSGWIAFYSNFFKEIQWLEKNYFISSENGDKLIKEITDKFINKNMLNAATKNMESVLHGQGLPADTINSVIHRFKTNFTKMLIPTVRENALIRSTVACKIRVASDI